MTNVVRPLTAGSDFCAKTPFNVSRYMRFLPAKSDLVPEDIRAFDLIWKYIRLARQSPLQIDRPTTAVND